MKKKVIFYIIICFIVTCFISLGISLAAKNAIAIKVEKSRPYVFDASYDSKGLVESYPKFSNMYYLSDLDVPYINIDSVDGRKANLEISEIYDSLLHYYEKGMSDSFTYIDYVDYKYYINNKLLSVFISYGISDQLGVKNYYHTFNFNLSTGKYASYKNIIKSYDINDEVIKNKIKNVVLDYTNDSKYYKDEDNNFNTYVNEAYQEYLNSKKDNTIRYYVDSKGILNVVLDFSVPYDRGMDSFFITID